MKNTKPSPETLILLDGIKEDMAEWKLQFKETLNQIPTMDKMENFILKIIESNNEKIDNKMKEMQQENEKRYAPKHIGSVIIWLIVAVSGGIISLFFNIINKLITK